MARWAVLQVARFCVILRISRGASFGCLGALAARSGTDLVVARPTLGAINPGMPHLLFPFPLWLPMAAFKHAELEFDPCQLFLVTLIAPLPLERVSSKYYPNGI